MLEYMTIAELTARAKEQSKTLSEIVLADQSIQMEIPEEQLYERMERSLTVMEAADGPQYVKTAKCQYDCGGQTTTAYHIFVRVPKQGEITP